LKIITLSFRLEVKLKYKRGFSPNRVYLMIKTRLTLHNLKLDI